MSESEKLNEEEKLRIASEFLFDPEQPWTPEIEEIFGEDPNRVDPIEEEIRRAGMPEGERD